MTDRHNVQVRPKRLENSDQIIDVVVQIEASCRERHLTRVNGYAFPLTQAEFGDALGLSTVHVNRTLQDLRGDGLITLRNGSVTVLDWDRLKEAGEFDPTFLHLSKEAA